MQIKHSTLNFSPDDFAVMDDMTMDWQRWDTLLNDFETPVQPRPAAIHLAQLAVFWASMGSRGIVGLCRLIEQDDFRG